ncbi:MAG: hypothetical protein RBS57_18950 [Desulforhabdus sp.]|jgi:hypothetical protein|nr:hypothetical protein [Desulforhabdus sp.]
MGYNLKEQIMVEGVVTPCNWDQEGTVIAVTISAKDEEEYLIHANAKGRDLIKHMHAHVRVKGVFQSHKEKEVFVVKEYEVIS